MDRRSSRGCRAKAPPAGSALDGGLRLLASRVHSRLELRQKLHRRGYDPVDVEAALGRLAELGYVDDGAFARGLVRRRSGVRGPRALAGELPARGVDSAGVAKALEGGDAEGELAAAASVA